MTRVEHTGGIAGLVIDGVVVSLEGSRRRDLHPCTAVFAALLELILVYRARPSWGRFNNHVTDLPATVFNPPRKQDGSPCESSISRRSSTVSG